MTVLNHAFSALMASVLHRQSLFLGLEGKPTETDERWCSQNNARSCGTEVGRAGATSQHGWPVRSRDTLGAHAWLCS